MQDIHNMSSRSASNIEVQNLLVETALLSLVIPVCTFCQLTASVPHSPIAFWKWEWKEAALAVDY